MYDIVDNTMAKKTQSKELNCNFEYFFLFFSFYFIALNLKQYTNNFFKTQGNSYETVHFRPSQKGLVMFSFKLLQFPLVLLLTILFNNE